MDITKIAAVLLVIIAIISLVAIYRNKNLRQKLHLPGISWDFETSDGNGSKKSEKQTDAIESNTIDFGQDNAFGGSVQNVAGRDVLANTSETESTEGNSSVGFGKGNTFIGDVKNIAGRDVKDQENNKNQV